MRVAYFCSKFPSLTTTFIQNEVYALRDSEIDVVLIANHIPKKNGLHPKDQFLLKETYYLNKIKKIVYLKSNLNWFIKSPKKYLKCLLLALRMKDNFKYQRIKNLIHFAVSALLADYLIKKEVNHVHVHFAFGAASVAIFLKKLSGIPYSITVHGSDVLLKRPLVEEKLKHAKFIISNCRYHINNLRRRFPSIVNKNFFLVRIGIDFNNHLWKPTNVYGKNSKHKILNIGRLVPVKSHEILIRACAILRDHNVDFLCKIAGDGPEKKKLKDIISKFGLSSHVILLGNIFEKQVARLYDWADIFVLSSRSEGTPMTIVEAMSKEKPVIAPKITGIPEMIIDSHTGLLYEPGSANDLADKLIDLCRDPELCALMGKNGRKRAEKMFDINSNINKIIALFLN